MRSATAIEVVAPDHLPEVPRRRQLVVHPAVHDHVGRPAGLLPVDDPGDVHAGLADQIAAEFDDDAGLRQQRGDPLAQEPRQIVADRRQVEGLVPARVRDAEPAAEIEVPDGRRHVGQPEDQVHGAPLRLADVVGAQVLRAREDVEALEVDVVAQPGEHAGHPFRVDPELLRPAAQAHPGAAHREVGIDPDRDPGRNTEGGADRAHPGQFRLRFQFHRHTGRDRLGQFPDGLAGPGETDAVGGHRRVEGVPQLSRRGHVEAVDQAAQVLRAGRASGWP